MSKALKKADPEVFPGVLGQAMKAAAKKARRVAKSHRTADQGLDDEGRQDRGSGTLRPGKAPLQPRASMSCRAGVAVFSCCAAPPAHYPAAGIRGVHSAALAPAGPSLERAS